MSGGSVAKTSGGLDAGEEDFLFVDELRNDKKEINVEISSKILVFLPFPLFIYMK